MNGTALPADIADKLAKVLGLLGSDHDGEVANAGRRAHALLRSAGVTWHEVLNPVRPLPLPSPERHWRRPATICQSVKVCLSWPEALNDWERGYLHSISGKKSLTEKQRLKLHDIINKVEAFVLGADD